MSSISQEILSTIYEALCKQLKPEQILIDPADCFPYRYDNSRYQAQPDMVVFAQSHEDVVSVAKLCHHYHVPLVARGRGTGTPGGSVPIAGGIVLSFEKMNKILSIDPANRFMVVEPGVTNQTVQNAASEFGFFWAPDPSSSATCSVGGNLAFNSAGPRAVKYGTTRENTLALRAVSADGRTFRTGRSTSKTCVGYDLTRLLIGSEGTLAIITEATLKLLPKAAAKHTFQLLYKDLDSATLAVTNIMAQAFVPCALEFIDQNGLKLLQNHREVNIPEESAAMLLIDIDGPEAAMPEASAAIQQAAKNSGLIQIHMAQDEKQSQQLWQARKKLSPLMRDLAAKKINEDVVVPVSYLPALITGVHQLADKFNLTNVNFGHAGNGNIHVNLLVNPENTKQVQDADQCLRQIFDLVLALNGSLSGEHGVGLEKKAFIAKEIDPISLSIMKQIKSLLDPHGILNPGKIFVE